MVHKRPFSDEESYEIAYKHPRQWEHNNQLAMFVKIVPCNDIPEKHQASVGEGARDFSKSQGGERLVNNTGTELLIEADKEFEATAPDSSSSLSWVTGSNSEEDSRSETAVRMSFSPGSLLLDYPFRKQVPVGPDYQADIPVCGHQAIKKTSGYLDTSDPIFSTQSSGLDPMVDGDNREKLMGTCVIPMPDSEQAAHSGSKFGCGRIGCSCPDWGSVRCVRQHVMEAREKLRGTLGHERFVKLGFGEMGVEVAQKWSEEEEQVFHQVVFSNPASLGKNFWDNLSVVFPCQTKKDIVSYYFNVFMLQKRAEQNRCNSLNIDSDDDEWQGSDDDDEFGMAEDYEDSEVDSLVDQDDPGYYNQDYEEDFHADDEDGDETYDNNDDRNVEDDRGSAGDEDDGGVDNILETCFEKTLDGCNFNTAAKSPQHGGVDHDVQDDSCTSCEYQPNGADSFGPVDAGGMMPDSRVRSDSNPHFQSSYDGLSGGVNHEYGLEPCDAKVWDIGYFTGPKKDVEFLPTSNMIEEVFGKEAWNNKGTKCKGIS